MICLFFGSFNPIHWGHIALGKYACDKLPCREVWFVLSPLNPQKEAAQQWAYSQRKALIQEALQRYPQMKLCEVERDMPQPLYTWRTIQALGLLYPNEQFILLIGSDNLLKIRTWAKWQYLLSLITLYVYPRPGYPIDEADFSDIPYTLCNDAELHDISSTQIRESLKNKQLN